MHHRSLAIPFVVLALLLPACTDVQDASAESGSAQSSTAGDLTATVTTRTVRLAGPPCDIDLSLPVVEVRANPEATSRIAAAFATKTGEQMCRDVGLEPTETMTLTGSFRVEMNERGLLSIRTEGSAFVEGMARPSVEMRARTFDLRSGNELRLGDALTARGVERARATCVTKLRAALARDLPGSDLSFVDEACGEAVTSNPIGFSVDREGLVLNAPLPDILIGSGAAVVPWTELANELEPGPVADWVATR